MSIHPRVPLNAAEDLLIRPYPHLIRSHRSRTGSLVRITDGIISVMALDQVTVIHEVAHLMTVDPARYLARNVPSVGYGFKLIETSAGALRFLRHELAAFAITDVLANHLTAHLELRHYRTPADPVIDYLESFLSHPLVAPKNIRWFSPDWRGELRDIYWSYRRSPDEILLLWDQTVHDLHSRLENSVG